MKRSATAVILGVSLGFLGVVLYTKLRERWAEEDADALVDRIARQLQDLEHADVA